MLNSSKSVVLGERVRKKREKRWMEAEKEGRK